MRFFCHERQLFHFGNQRGITVRLQRIQRGARLTAITAAGAHSTLEAAIAGTFDDLVERRQVFLHGARIKVFLGAADVIKRFHQAGRDG